MTKKTSDDTAKKAEEIVGEGGNIREQIHTLIIDALDAGHSGFEQISDTIEEAMRGSLNALQAALPEEQESVLREVFQGLGDAVGTVSEATKEALEEEFALRASSLVDRAKSTGAEIKPSLEAAFDAARAQPIDFATETAAAGMRLTRQTAGSLLSAAGALLKEAGERIAAPGSEGASSVSEKK